MKQVILITLSILTAISVFAGNDLDEFLKSVEANNLKLKSFREWSNAKKIGAQTGLTPDNPEVEFGYLPGNADEMGNMTTFKVSQKIEFPTVYSQKNKLSKLQQEQSDFEFQSQRLTVLNDASRFYIQRIYLLKANKLFADRKSNAEQLLRSFEQKQQAGETNILEVNKLKLELAQARKLLAMIETQQNTVDKQLSLANAGKAFTFNSLDYPLFPYIDTEELVRLYREKDPELRIVSGNVNIASQEIKLEQNKNLPEIALNYGYEKTPEVKYAGPGAAMTIPLWQNKNRVKQARSGWEFAQAKLTEETLGRENSIREKSAQLAILKASLDEMQSTLSSVNSVELLGKALSAGEISLINYLTEVQYFYLMQEELLNLEHDYYLLLADLNLIRLAF